MEYTRKVYGDWVFIYEDSEIKIRMMFADFASDEEALEFADKTIKGLSIINALNTIK